MPDAAPTGYRFGEHFLDVRNRQLWRGGEQIGLSARYFDALVLLVGEQGRLVEKDRLFAEVWHDVIVSDAALTQCIKAIRQALGDAARRPRYVKTVPKHGYTFIAEAVPVAGAMPEAARTLREARAVLDRARANHRTHGLFPDADALALLTPFGPDLGLDDDEATLLARSLLHRGHPLPEWLGDLATLPDLVAEAARHADPRLRHQALENAHLHPTAVPPALLTEAALHDADFGVKTAAALALAENVPDAARRLTEADASFFDRAVALALIRDRRQDRLPLPALPILFRVAVVALLGGVRLRRHGAAILRQTFGGTLGGVAAGLLGGLLYGIVLAGERAAAMPDGRTLTLAFITLAVGTGVLGSLGVCGGLLTAAHLTTRHSRAWTVAGAALGGLVVGGVAEALGTNLIAALVGQAPADVTGAAEGAAVGFAVGLGAVLDGRFDAPRHRLRLVLDVTLVATVVFTLLAMIGWPLFIGSLAAMTHAFTASPLALDALNPVVRVGLSAVEGLFFGACVAGGMALFRRTGPDGLSAP